MTKPFRAALIATFILGISFECEAQHYDIQLSADDSFLVRFRTDAKLPEIAIFQFARSIPGVYGEINYGSLVIDLNAYDRKDRPLSVTRLSKNQWKILRADQLHHIDYEIDDSFGNIEIQSIPYIAGTAIETDHLLMNTVGVLGYIDELSAEPASLSLDLPAEWIVGSALIKKDDRFYARNFNDLVDAPIMAGEIDVASTIVNGVSVELYSFSSTNAISAQQTLSSIAPAIEATAKFLGVNPVDRYVFLMQFLDADSKKRNNIRGIGALEHSNSSSYVLSEDERILDFLNEWVAHEYFHIVTPLNLHSREIRPFRYDQINPDSHLWLYEGVTVWASEIMLLRDQQIGEKEYLSLLSEKIIKNEKNGARKSLVELSRSIYDGSTMDDFDYIDSTGSLIIFCLDVMLLSESGNHYGMRDLLVDLMTRFGQDMAFDDDKLFDEIEIIAGANAADFIDSHIVNNTPLNSEYYLDLIGYQIAPEGGEITSLSELTERQMALRQSWLSN